MYCKNCGSQIDDDSKFCDKCGQTISKNEENNSNVEQSSNEKKDNVNNDDNNIEYTEAQMRKKSFLSATLGLLFVVGVMWAIGKGFWFLINGDAEIPLGLYIIYMCISIFGGIKLFLSLLVNNVYDGKCPYCDTKINIEGEAADCPMCKKRIIVKDEKFYKV